MAAERTTFDVIVLGGGSTGTNVAWYARDNGLSVAVVESRLVGGECSYWACIPSKALIGPSEALAAARRLPGAAAAVTGDLDVAAVFARRDEWTSDLDDGAQASWVEGIGAELIRGRGRIVGERRVTVDGDDGASLELAATRAVVVASGSRAKVPSIDGLGDIRAWDNRDVTQATRVPERLLVLGGGAVGCELGQAYHRMGAQVTVLARSDRLLSRYEPAVGDTLMDAFAAEGIRVLTGTTVTSVARPGVDEGPVTVTTDGGQQLTGDELLLAVGRTPNTEDIGLETVGLAPSGPLEVDDRLAVAGVDGDWLFAAGDVTDRARLTHQGKYQARIVGDVLAGEDLTAWADHRAVPQVVFTDPQIATVGSTTAEARAAGLDVKTVVSDLTAVSGGALHGSERGYANLVIDQRRRVLVGASFVGPGAGEMLHAATIAIVGEVPLHLLWHATPAFPTASEVWLRLLEADRGIS